MKTEYRVQARGTGLDSSPQLEQRQGNADEGPVWRDTSTSATRSCGSKWRSRFELQSLPIV